MNSSKTSLRNGNDNFDSQERRRVTDTPEKLFTDGLGQSFTKNQQSPRYTTVDYQQTSNDNYDVELLKHLSKDFSDLLNRTDISGCCNDCWLNVRGTFMSAHRCVLAARSNTFSAVMSGHISRLDPNIKNELTTTTKNDKLVISIDKTDPETMKLVIIFLYTAKCDLNERNAFHILDAACRYDIKSLKVYVAQFLVNHINTNNVLRLIEYAYKYDNLLLKQRCIDYFIDNGKEVMNITELWKPFSDKYPMIVSELLYWTVRKEEYHQQND
ncbi:unnamed protein product [Rotaria sordida]|uniref:BTB domain-containing protein n=1 Tax=Rotaria sordida TaxID=392033 RepID=A0A815STC8_9BILA|nr:unnamed protein product [Rotaria sordida]